MNVICTFCGAFHWIAEKHGKPLRHPRFATCCQNGFVNIPILPNPPPFLASLLDGEHRQNVRQYNMTLAFTSLGVTEDCTVNRRGGWVLRISGELCHMVESLRADEGEAPAFAQLYIYDSHYVNALCQRMHRNGNLRGDTMSALQDMLLSHHGYVRRFHHVFEILRDYPDALDASVKLRVMPGQTSHQYTLPTSDELAVILPGDGTAPQRVVDQRANLTQINDGHPAYAPLHYVLLFPHGTHGWRHELRQRQPPGVNPPSQWQTPRVTQTQYSAYRMHTRLFEYSMMHRSGRLF
jgi:hypothetical protein